MAFGQQSGPPATARQLRELLDLVNAAGHSDFRDARGPLGLTQRQAGGKFTRDEADAFIAQLEQEHAADGDEAGPATSPTSPAAAPAATARPKAAASSHEQELRRVPSEALAAELQRRGWVVMEP